MGCGATKEDVNTNNQKIEDSGEVAYPENLSEAEIIEELSAKSDVSEGDENEDELLDKLIASSPGKSPTSPTIAIPESKDL